MCKVLSMALQDWSDYKLTWNASEYGGVQSITVPAVDIWTPDVVLYNRCFFHELSLSRHCKPLIYLYGILRARAKLDQSYLILSVKL